VSLPPNPSKGEARAKFFDLLGRYQLGHVCRRHKRQAARAVMLDRRRGLESAADRAAQDAAGEATAGRTSNIVFNEHYEGDGVIIYKRACKLVFEGIASKPLGSRLGLRGGLKKRGANNRAVTGSRSDLRC
jgi:hypothetical protein